LTCPALPIPTYAFLFSRRRYIIGTYYGLVRYNYTFDAAAMFCEGANYCQVEPRGVGRNIIIIIIIVMVRSSREEINEIRNKQNKKTNKKKNNSRLIRQKR